MITKQLIDAWRINQKMNRILLDAIEEDWLILRAGSDGRTIGEQWGHVSSVRVNWIHMKLKDTRDILEKFDKKRAHEKKYLIDHLERTAVAFESIFEQYKDGIYAKGHDVTITTFYSYILSHEAHHRGQVLLHLKLNGHVLPEEVRYGIWNW